MVFVVDDLAAWLVGLLADAGRKKVTGFIFGDEQERALQSATSAAVQQALHDLSPAGDEQAMQLAAAVRKALKKPELAGPRTGQVTLLEALHATIAARLAVVDDADLAGRGRPAAAVLGVSGAVLANKLTDHLVREITFRGSHGGPLSPLADQLNHDRTHRMLARLAGGDHDARARAGGGAPGRPLSEVTDPFALEVHRPVEPEDSPRELPALPAYVPREHDAELGSVARAAAGGSSVIAVLVGGSSTGKTRACWEALRLLRDRPGPWRLWHPIDPTRPGAALRELPDIGPRTVVWMNEAQFYLDVPDGGLGERVAAGLRELLRDPARAPVLVLATLWPQFWDELAGAAAGGGDPHAQARELLAGHDITVPAAFTAAQLRQLSETGDARLALAAAGAQDGQIIQFLAGVPELMARYRNSPPAAKALIHAAMDARRLGAGIGLPYGFLGAAASGYVTDAEWDALGEDWLEQSLVYTAIPCKGVRGPLARIRPRPGRFRPAGPRPRDGGQRAAGLVGIRGGPLYRLADYLDQYGRAHRKGQVPPAGFWAAAAEHALPGDHAVLGRAAAERGLYRDGAQLLKNAAARGDPHAGRNLIGLLHDLRPADHRPASWAAAHAALGEPLAVALLLGALREAGAQDQVAALLRRDPAAHAALGDPRAVALLLGALREAGAQDQVAALLRRDPAAHAALGDPLAVIDLLRALREAGAQDQVTALASRATAHAALDSPWDVRALLDILREAGAQGPVTALLHSAAFHADLGEPRALAYLLDALREAGVQGQVTELASRAALGNPLAVALLLGALREEGAQDQVAALLRRDPAAHADLSDPRAVARLLGALREAGAQDQVAALASRAAAHADLSDPWAVADLLRALREAAAQDQVAALLRRDPAAHADLGESGAVAYLLDALREAAAQDQVAALLRRDPAAHADLGEPRALAHLLRALREADAQDQVTALASRLPGVGMFKLFRELDGRQDRFGFGREADGSPAKPWGWDDLGRSGLRHQRR